MNCPKCHIGELVVERMMLKVRGIGEEHKNILLRCDNCGHLEDIKIVDWRE